MSATRGLDRAKTITFRAAYYLIVGVGGLSVLAGLAFLWWLNHARFCY